jgi:ankyrin repeat protein
VPVWLSIQKGDVETLKTQLDAGLDVNTRHSNGYPMLHYATDRSQLEVAKLLLDHGADINLKTTRSPSLTPLDLAWKKRNDEFIDLLIKRGDASRICTKRPNRTTSSWCNCISITTKI